MFGLSGEWLLHEGRPLADVTVLSHPEQLTRLSAACPPAAPTAVLAGDPCYDRLLAALPFRERYRRALGVGPERRLVVLNSTWNPESLFGDGGGGRDSGNDMLPSLLPRLMAELPADEYRVAAVLHPNIWHGHGPGQIRTWLDSAQRAGLTLVPPLEGWRQAVIAADLILGDQGSVSFYGAAAGAPVLLCAAPEDGLDPDSPVAEFVRAAPRLRPYERVEPQLDAVLRGHRRGDGPSRRAAERTSSAPGRSAALLRRSFYGLLGMSEPDTPALLTPLPLPAYEPDRRTDPVRVLTRLPGAPVPEVEVVRHPAPVREPAGVGPAHDPMSEAHISVSEDTTDPSRLALADVIVCHADEDDPRIGPPGVWTSEVLRRHPHCALAVYVTGADGCTARTRDGVLFELAADRDRTGRRDLCDPAAYASALHAWLAGGRSAADLTSTGLTVRTGCASHHVRVSEPGEDLDEGP